MKDRAMKCRSMKDRCLFAGGVILLAAGVACAQNALGDGQGLRRDLRVAPVTGGTFDRPDIRDEVRMRNAIVTGNITGGKALQASVGYVDPSDFRVSLPSDTLFRFRRDSFTSGSSGLRGTEGLQYQYAYTSGNAVLSRGGSTSMGAGVPASGAGTTAGYTSNVVKPEPMLEGSMESNLKVGTLRSTGAFTATRGFTPAIVGYERAGLNMQRLTASGLLGIRKDYVEVPSAPGATPKPSPGAVPTGADTKVDMAAPVAVPMRTMYDDLRDRLDSKSPRGVTPGTTTPEAKPTPGAAPGDGGTKAPGASGTPSPGLTHAWESQIDRLRRDLLLRQAGRGELTPEEKAAKEAEETELVRAIREAGGNVTTFITGQAQPGDLYVPLMHEGSTYLATGRYFDAEERFARALGMRPGDPSAMVGRIHAQLGGGLLMSAAMNLRLLYEQHPELLGTRFSGDTMPGEERLKEVEAEVRDRIADAKKRGLPLPGESALLLAYLGFQRSEPASVEEGLAVMKQAAGDKPDPLGALLEKAWKPGGK